MGGCGLRLGMQARAVAAHGRNRKEESYPLMDLSIAEGLPLPSLWAGQRRNRGGVNAW